MTTATIAPSILSVFLSHLLFLAGLQQLTLVHAAAGGRWMLLQSIGVIAMHMQLLHSDRIVIYDLTHFGPSNISLPGNHCWKKDCSAHSVEYDVLANSVRPLTLQTDSWCSSGSVAYNGQLIQTGGYLIGDHVVREFWPCAVCDWWEVRAALLAKRWYSTNVKLPDGGALVVGGRRQFTYEFYPKSATTNWLVPFPFLRQTNDRKQENNLYPFVHLNVDGNLFVYANNRAILLDYKHNVVVREYPSMPGRHPRNYPSTGSSVLLPLKNLAHSSVGAEVLICGGAPRGSFRLAKRGKYIAALNTCGRLKITDASPNWVMETMPLARVMGDMVLLPHGHVLIINGAAAGTAGWEYGRKPVLHPVLYIPTKPLASRFEVQNPSSTPRLYHSSAVLVRDGRVLVGGSNPHKTYNFTGVSYPTDLSLEAYSPSYLDSQVSSLRPVIISPNTTKIQLKYNQSLAVCFWVSGAVSRNQDIAVTMVAPPFATHSFSMNQRLLVLTRSKLQNVVSANSSYQVEVSMPKSRFVAPPGYYMLFVIHKDIPSEGIWVQVGEE